LRGHIVVYVQSGPVLIRTSRSVVPHNDAIQKQIASRNTDTTTAIAIGICRRGVIFRVGASLDGDVVQSQTSRRSTVLVNSAVIT
jgi:hypothetical protein